MLFENISKEKACIIEEELIKKYKTQSKKYGYNIANGGLGGCTVKGKYHHLSKSVYQYSLDGEYIREWDNAQRASEKLNICVSDIHATCRNIGIKKAGSYMWSYKKLDYLEPYVHEGINKETILQLDHNFNVIKKYKNISYVTQPQYNKERVTNCCKRRAITHDGYYWVYENEFNSSFILYIQNRIKNSHKSSLAKPINQYDLAGNIICTYKSAKDVEEKTGFNRHTIQAYCKREIGNCGKSTGYIWRYA